VWCERNSDAWGLMRTGRDKPIDLDVIE